MFVLLTRISCYIHYIVCFDKAVHQHHFTALVLNQDDFVFPKDICLKKKKKKGDTFGCHNWKGWDSYWHRMGRHQRCCSTSHNAEDGSHNNHLAQNINAAKLAPLLYRYERGK